MDDDKVRTYLRLFLFSLSLIHSVNGFALAQDAMLWLGINAKQSLTEQLSTYVFSQVRIKSQSHPWQVGLLEGGIGYHVVKNQSFWVGYRWSGRNPYNGFYQENRLFQQIINEINLTPCDKMVLRTRLEEIENGNSDKISVRLRQRVALLMERALITNIRPLLYDEIFFQLNNTPDTTNQLVSENRVFVGFNLYTSHKKNWWEIGYINQFQVKRPQDSQNTMNHILSVTYNF